MTIDCPNCGGRIDERSCVGCGKTFRTADLLGHFPPPERVKQEQDEREDLAIREAG